MKNCKANLLNLTFFSHFNFEIQVSIVRYLFYLFTKLWWYSSVPKISLIRKWKNSNVGLFLIYLETIQCHVVDFQRLESKKVSFLVNMIAIKILLNSQVFLLFWFWILLN